MRFERITDTQHEMYKRAMVLYALVQISAS